MKNKNFSAALIGILVCIFLIINSHVVITQTSIENLPPKYKKWFTEDAVYIITQQEKELFLSLKTDEQRNSFIEGFWRRRDTIPETVVNEFRKEHYERIKYATEKLSDDTPREGWRTDRGKIHILLGKPNDIYNKISSNILYPLQVWDYRYVKMRGMPSALRLIFFKRFGVGEFRLYNPIFDGLQSLLTPANTRFASNPNLLPHIDVEVRQAAFSIAPGYTPQTSQDILMELQSPSRIIAPVARRKLREVVEAKVTFVTMPIDLLLTHWKKDSVTSYFDYLMEIPPEYLTFKEIDDKFIARLDIYGSILSKDQVVAEISKEINIELTKEQLEECKDYYFNFLDRKLLIPGEYQLRLFIRNYISNEIGRTEKNFQIPEIIENQLSLSSIIWAYKLDRSEVDNESNSRPFVFEKSIIAPKADATFQAGRNFYLYFEIYYPKDGNISLNPSLTVRYSIIKDGEILQTNSDILNQVTLSSDNHLPILRPFSSAGLQPGAYSLRIEVEGTDLDKTVRKEIDFSLSEFAQNFGRFRYENTLANRNFIMHYELGRQYYIQQLYDKAKLQFRIALDFNPNGVIAMVSLAKCLLFEKNYEEAINILQKALEKKPYNYDVLTTLSAAQAALNRYQEAIKNYQTLLEIGYSNVSIYNALGLAYFKEGKIKEAIEAFQSSLEIKPDQPEVQKILSTLKNK